MICKYIEYVYIYIYSIIDSKYDIEYVRSIPIPYTYINTGMYTRVYIFIFIITTFVIIIMYMQHSYEVSGWGVDAACQL